MGLGDGDGNSSTERHPLHSYSAPGVYEVCLTVSNESSSNTSCQTLFLGVSSTEEESAIDVSIFPNPVRDNLRLTLHNYLPQDATLRLINISGQQVLATKVIGGVNMIDVSGLSSGTYVYEVREGLSVCLLYTSPSPRDLSTSRMPSSA